MFGFPRLWHETEKGKATLKSMFNLGIGAAVGAALTYAVTSSDGKIGDLVEEALEGDKEVSACVGGDLVAITKPRSFDIVRADGTPASGVSSGIIIGKENTLCLNLNR